MQQSTWCADFVDQYMRKYRRRHDESTSRAEAVAVVGLAGGQPGDDVLDAPCGSGRHCVALAEEGYHVVGVDSSEAMLTQARGHCPGVEWPRWELADYRSLPFADKSFDVALNLFTSLGFYGEQGDMMVLREFRRVLRPGGCLVVDTHHRDRLVTADAPTRDFTRLDDGDLLLEESAFDQVTGWWTMTHTTVCAKGGERSFTSRLRIYSATEWANMLISAGFENVDFYGGLDRRPLDLKTRLVAVGRI